MVFCNNFKKEYILFEKESHNPYFNRWFSAIGFSDAEADKIRKVTILILIDGFLQYNKDHYISFDGEVTILILIDGFLQ